MPLSVRVEAGIPVLAGGFGEGVDHDPGGDHGVGGAAQDVAGVVIEPGDDLGVGPLWACRRRGGSG